MVVSGSVRSMDPSIMRDHDRIIGNATQKESMRHDKRKTKGEEEHPKGLKVASLGESIPT